MNFILWTTVFYTSVFSCKEICSLFQFLSVMNKMAMKSEERGRGLARLAFTVGGARLVVTLRVGVAR